VKKYLLIILLLVSTGVGAAMFLHAKYPYFFFGIGQEVFMCFINNTNPENKVRCIGVHRVTKEETPYVCTTVPASEGYLKDCVIYGAI